jgi:hypothetical protein
MRDIQTVRINGDSPGGPRQCQITFSWNVSTAITCSFCGLANHPTPLSREGDGQNEESTVGSFDFLVAVYTMLGLEGFDPDVFLR